MASHRLIQNIGKRYGLFASEAVYDCLNEYYFVEGHSLNDRPRLAGVVAELLSNLLGPEETTPTDNELLEFLNGNEGREEIMKALQALNKLGIHSIPKFIIEGKTIVDGAARPEVFVQVFRDIERKGEIHAGPFFGDILGVPDDIIVRGSHTPESIAV